MSLLTTSFYTVAPKAAAVIRDLILLHTLGLGKESALVMAMLYVTQYIGSLISNAFTSEAIANKPNRNINLIKIVVAMAGCVSVLAIPPYLLNLIGEIAFDVKLLILFIILSSIVQTYISISASYFIANNRGVQSIFLLDAIPSIVTIFSILIFKENLTLFSCALFVGLAFSACAYHFNVEKISVVKVRNRDTKKDLLKILRLSAFAALMSSTNLIDIQIIGEISINKVATYSLIQRYTVIAASMLGLIFIRHFANRAVGFFKLKIRNELILYALFILGCLFLYWLMSESELTKEFSTVGLALMQVPAYILLTTFVTFKGFDLKFKAKLQAAAIAIAAKYITVMFFGLSLETIFISHAVLNATAYYIIKNEK